MKKSILLCLLGASLAIGVGVGASSYIKRAEAAYTGGSPYTITLNDKSLKDETKYVHTETDTTISGIGLSWNHLNPSNGQLYHNDTTTGNFYLYSTDALPNKITGIKITKDYGGTWNKIYARVGTSALSTTDLVVSDDYKATNSGMEYSWSFNVDDAKYFCVYLGDGSGWSAATKATTIEVYYAHTPTSISIDGGSSQETTFYLGEDFSSSGLIVNVNYDDSSSEKLTEDVDYTVTPPDMSSVGDNKDVTISPKSGGKAEGVSAITYKIDVKPARTLVGVTLSGTISKATYIEGENWDLTGLNVAANYMSGEDPLPDVNLGTLNSLVTAGDITYTLDPAKAELGTTKLTIKNISYNGERGSTTGSDFLVDVEVRQKPCYELFEEETINPGKFVIATNTDIALKNVLQDSGKRLIGEEVTVEEGFIYEPSSAVVWTIAKDGDYFTIHNEEINKYLVGTNANECGIADSSTGDVAKWSFTYDSEKEGYKIVNKSISGYLQKNSGGDVFGCYSAIQSGPLKLYRFQEPDFEYEVENNKTTLGKGGKALISTTLIHGAVGTPVFTLKSGASYLGLTDNGDGTALVSAIKEGAAEVEISLTGVDPKTINFTVLDVPLYESIRVKTQPTKTKYIVGETFDPTGLVVEVTYTDDSKDELTTGFTLSEPDMSIKGVKEITVTLEDATYHVIRTTTFEIDVEYQELTISEALATIEALDLPEGDYPKYIDTDKTYRITGKMASTYAEWKTNNDIYLADKYNETDASKRLLLWDVDTSGSNPYEGIKKQGATVTVESKLRKYGKNSTTTILETTRYPELISVDDNVGKLVSSVAVDTSHTELNSHYVGDSELDLTGLVMIVYYNELHESDTVRYNDDPSAFMSMFTYSGFDSSKDGPCYVTITHKESGFSDKLYVYINNIKPSKLEVKTNPSKTEYNSGDEFIPNGAEFTLTYNKSTLTETLNWDDEKITYETPSKDGKLHDGDTSVKAIYSYVDPDYGTDKTVYCSIPVSVVKAYVTSISAEFSSSGMGKDLYDVGDEFSTKSLLVYVNYSDGTSVKYNDKGDDLKDYFKITPPDMSTAGVKDVSIKYHDEESGKDFTTTVEITIRGVEKIRVKTNPYRLIYRTGVEFDPSGLEIEEVYTTGETRDIGLDYDGLTITPPDMNIDGPNKEVIIEYKGFSTSFKIDIWLSDDDQAALIAKELQALEDSVFIEEYTDTNWALVQSYIEEARTTLSGFDPRDEGEHYSSDVMAVINSAKDKIGAVPVRNVTKIELTSLPNKTTYMLNEEFDPTGLVVTATFDEGSPRAVTNYLVTGFDSSSTGMKTLTVTYGGKSVTFQVKIITETYLVSISVTSNPTKTTYYIGEDFDPTGLVITATYSNGVDETEQVVSGYTLSGFESYEVSESVVITVTYEGKTASFTVSVTEDPAVIALKEAKANAIAEIEAYYNSIDTSKFSEEAKAELLAAKEAAIAAINSSTSIENVSIALETGKNNLKEIVKENTPKAKSNLGLILGLSIGGGVLVLGGIGVGAYFIIKKKRVSA